MPPALPWLITLALVLAVVAAVAWSTRAHEETVRAQVHAQQVVRLRASVAVRAELFGVR